MNTDEKTRALIAEARECAPGDDATELAVMVHRLADALEAATRQPSENDREALKRIAEVASEQRLKESIGEWREALGAGIDSFPDDWGLEFWHAGYKHGALAMIEHQLSRAPVPNAATEELERIKPLFENLCREYPRECNKRASAEAERDAALAVVERVRAALAHDEIEGPDHDASVYRDEAERKLSEIEAALDGAPEPEWEYALFMTESDGSLAITAWKPDEFEHARKAWPDVGFIERRRIKAPWLPVEGEKP